MVLRVSLLISIMVILISLLKISRYRHDVTATMTTCNRLDLTIVTLSTLFKYNRGVKRVLVNVDCYNRTFVNTLDRIFGERIHLFNSTSTNKIRQKRLMDNLRQLTSMVDTPWWFHCEDDWEFYRHGFVDDSISTLSHSNVYMIIGRKPNGFKPFVDYWIDDNHGVLRRNAGPGGVFTSYTANPAVLKTVDVHRLIGDFSNYKGEWHVSKQLGKKDDALVGIFKLPYYKHIGGGRSSIGGGSKKF